MFVFVRQDLPLAHQIVQSNHAVLSIASKVKIDGIPNIILIGVPNVSHLARVQDLCMVNDLDFYSWIEPDHDMGFTSLAAVPLTKQQKEIFKKYQLWKPVYTPVAQLVERSAA